MQVLTPTTETELGEAVAAAHAADTPLEIAGQGSKAGWGRAVVQTARLSLAGLAGIRDYAPAELVLTAGAGTPLRDIRRAVAAEGQHLAFEPPDLGPLFGRAPDIATIGGVVAANLSGPRRPFAGAARDFFLGFRAVNGTGELFKAGGKVVKNVTGYDLPKLLAGSFGTLGIMTEITLKIVPAPETSLSLVVIGQTLAAAQAMMTAALGSNADPTGAVYLPDGMAGNHPSLAAHVGAQSATVLRLEGSAASVAYRRVELAKICAGNTVLLDHHDSTAFWIECGALQALLPLRDAAIWLISAPPAGGAAAVTALQRLLPDCRYVMDWGGGRIWLAVTGTAADAHAGAIRAALTEGGHATLLRASDAQRAGDHVFQPEVPLELLRRLRLSFDPGRIFNRGRLHPEL
jgi:glycolate oxidase FAD binding subunit